MQTLTWVKGSVRGASQATPTAAQCRTTDMPHHGFTVFMPQKDGST
jgi:hypothetical protein